MSIDKLVVSIVGVLIIGLVYWFFFRKKEKSAVAQGSIEIVVDGGYSPELIEVKVGAPIDLIFFRKDSSTCLDEVVIADFKIRKALPLNAKTKVTITPEKKGSYEFTCGMNMYHGVLRVTD